MTISLASKWLLVVIGSTKYVEGNMRLQKYGIFIHKRIPELKEFYRDWKSDQFGGYSPKLAQDLKRLRLAGFVDASKIIKGDMQVNRYEISDKGRKEIESLVIEKKSLVERICQITQYYFSKSLKELIADTYILYPEYTKKSTIRAHVGREKIKRTFLSQEFEIPFESENEIKSNLENLTFSEHVFNDEEFREKLSKSIGLRKVPNLDPKSFENIKGILAKKIQTEDFDAVELVKEVRGC